MAQIKQAVKQTDPTATAILFGSRATGKAREDSDWDILVLLDKPKIGLNDELPLRDILYDIELETGEAISTFFFSKDDWNNRLLYSPLYASVKEDGIVL